MKRSPIFKPYPSRSSISPSRPLILLVVFALGFALQPPSRAETPNANLTDPGYSPVPGKLVGYGMTAGGGELVLSGQLPPEGENTGFVQVSGHFRTWGGLRDDGSLYLSGQGHTKPDLSEVQSKLVRISVCNPQTLAMDDAGRGYIWAPNGYLEVPPNQPLTNLVDIGACDIQGYALTATGELVSWGIRSAMSDDRRAWFAPYQGKIAALNTRSFGGMIVMQDGTGFQWLSNNNPNTRTWNDLGPLPDSLVFSGAGLSHLYRKASGELLARVGYDTSKIPKKPLRVLFYIDQFSLVEEAPRRWRVFGSDRLTEIDAIQKFLDETRPSAVAVVGAPARADNRERNGYGIVAIVPSETAVTLAPAVTSAEPTPTPTTVAAPAISDPRFNAILKLYQAEHLAKVASPHDTALAALNQKLDGALEREKKTAITAGNLDTVTAIIAEREALNSEVYPPGTTPSSPRIERLRGAWQKERAQIDTARSQNETTIRASLNEKLDELIRILTKERRIDEALKVKNFLETSAAGGIPR